MSYHFNQSLGTLILITLTSHWELLFLMEYQIMMIQLKIIRSSLSEALSLGSEQLNLNFQEH